MLAPGAGALVLGLLCAGCMSESHPLPTSGTVSIRLDDAHPIYAADLLDESGRPVLPRQAPYEKYVQLLIESGQEPDEGAYVDVRIEPPNALKLVPHPISETCEQLAGAYRCTAAEDGTADFIVRSESDWSGTATVQIEGRPDEKSFEVKPAGLPADASDFTLIVGGVDQNADKVLATYSALSCHIGPVPDAEYNKWPAGRVRERQAIVRANPPPQTPAAIEYAPVYVQSLHSEAKISLESGCPNAAELPTRLRVILDENGESPPFYFCFSDIGGSAVALSYFSGELVDQPNRILHVEPEPRLLRIRRLKTSVQLGLQQQPVVEVSAFDANLDPASMPIDIVSSDPTVLAPIVASMQLSADPNYPSQISADAEAVGNAYVRVTPRLFDSPRCDSASIEVTETAF